MIIRIFVALLALNMIAFVVRAEASERVFADEVPAENVYQLQEEMSGDFEREESDMYATIGSRLLSLSLSAQIRERSPTRLIVPSRTTVLHCLKRAPASTFAGIFELPPTFSPSEP